jgi:hypothetical protein
MHIAWLNNVVSQHTMNLCIATKSNSDRHLYITSTNKAGSHGITKALHLNTKTYDSQSLSFITFRIEDDHKSVARLSRISAKWTLNEPSRRPIAYHHSK